MATTKRTRTSDLGRASGAPRPRFRSGLEEKLAAQIEQAGIQVRYEQTSLSYTEPASQHSYTPDFELRPGLFVEGKGIFDADDRKKQLLVKQQHPDIEVRFVFTRAKTPIYKGSKTTYADWCVKHGFRYADRVIPASWLNEQGK